MKNINIIYNLENKIILKKRLFIFTLTIVLTFMILLVLILLNNIVVNARVNTYLNFNDIKYMYKIIFMIENLLIIIIAPIFLSRCINEDKKNMVIDNFLTTKITKHDIVLGKFLKLSESVLIIIISTFPIVTVSYSFGGIIVSQLMCKIVFIIFFSILFSATCLMCSSLIKKPNISLIVSYIIGIIFLIIINVLYKYMLDNMLLFILTLIIMITISVLFIVISLDSKIFEI